MYRVKKDPLVPSGVVATRKLMENSNYFLRPRVQGNDRWSRFKPGEQCKLQCAVGGRALARHTKKKKKRHLTDLVESVSHFASVAPAVVHEVLTSNMLLLSSRPTRSLCCLSMRVARWGRGWRLVACKQTLRRWRLPRARIHNR